MLRKSLFILCPLLTSVVCAQTPSPTAATIPPLPLIILVGPPLIGETTFAVAIAGTYRIPSISIEDLIRDNAVEMHKVRGEWVSPAEMRYDPAVSRYMSDRLKAVNLGRGITLDGYPATLVQLEDLSIMFSDLKPKLIALRLQVPDDTVRERAKTTGLESARPQIIEQRIKEYHREMDAISLYFPNAKIADIDGTLPEDKAWKAIQTVLDEAGLKPVSR